MKVYDSRQRRKENSCAMKGYVLKGDFGPFAVGYFLKFFVPKPSDFSSLTRGQRPGCEF